MNTKKLRELAERVANGDGAFTWFCHDARDLARAVLAEVSEAEKAHGVLVAALPYWASNYSLAAAAKAAADELDRFYDDSAPSSGTADPLDERAREELDRISDRLGDLEAHSDIARNRLAALEEGQRDLCCRLSGETAPVPAPADPLEAARANVAAWPEWKRQAASQQGATLDMDGNPMPHPLDKGPDPSAPPRIFQDPANILRALVNEPGLRLKSWDPGVPTVVFDEKRGIVWEDGDRSDVILDRGPWTEVLDKETGGETVNMKRKCDGNT